MTFTNSPLVTYTNITKNKTANRNHPIDTITIHCVVGQCTAKQCCDYFATTDRRCSANYVVGKDGSIGLSVEEKDISWCTSSTANDKRAVTIEVASDTEHPYAVTDAAYNALIQLVADICKRNNIKELKWKGDKSLIGQVDKQNMTVHRWFAAKSCPGEYLYERHGDIAAKVNAILNPESEKTEKPAPEKVEKPTIKKNDVVSISNDATYYDGTKKVPAWVKKKKWIVKEVSGDRVVIDKSQDGKNAICSPINVKFLTVDGAKMETPKTETKTESKVETTAPVVKKEVKVGSTVRLKKGAKTFNGGNLASFVYERNHKVKEINVDRVVITYNGIVVAAVRKSDLTVIN